MLCSQDRVLFGLEDFAVPQISNEYLEKLAKVISAVGIVITPADMKSVAATNNKRLALESVNQFSSTEGSYAAVQTRWKGETANEKPEGIILSKEMTPGSDSVYIKARLPANGITSRGQAALLPGKELPVTVMGAVIRWDKDGSSLIIDPLAAY